MRKVALFMVFVVLLSSISFSAENKQANPSDVLSWAIALKDGSWTVKALGTATGPEGTEALSWVVDPSGKITTQFTGELDKSCNGCFQTGQLLLDPVSGLSSTAMQEASKSNKEVATLGQVFTMQQQMKQLTDSSPIPAKSGQFIFSKEKDASGKEVKTAKNFDPLKFGNEDPKKFKETVDYLHASDLKLTEVKAVEEKVTLKPYNPQGIGSRSRFVFESKDMENLFNGDWKKGFIDYDLKQGLTNDKVTKADVVAGKEGMKAQINGNPPLDLPADSEIKVDKVSCTEDPKTKQKKCTTSVDVTVAQEKIIEATPKPGTLIDDTKKDPVAVSFCGKDYSMLPGSTMKVEMKKQGDVEDCTLKEGKILWSNKIDNQNQVFKVGGTEITADSAKWDHQEGFMDVKKDKDGNTLIEGTMKTVKLKDGTVINLEGQTNRGTMLMDTVKMKLSPNGDLLNMEVRAKARDVTVSYGDVTLDKLRSGDTPFWRDVKPVVLTPEKDGGVRVSTTKNDYILAPKIKPTSKAIFTIDEGLDPDIADLSMKSNAFVKSMIDRPLKYNPSSFTTSSDMVIPTDSLISGLTPVGITDPRYNPYVCSPDDFYCQIVSSPDASKAGAEQKKAEDANKIKVKKGDTPWDVAVDYELARILSLSEEDKKAIKDASTKGSYFDVLQQKLGSADSANGFQTDVMARYDRLRGAYSTWKLDGMEVDAQVMAEPLVTVVTSSVSTGQVVIHPANNAGRQVPSSAEKFLTQGEIDKTIETYYLENYINKKPYGMSDEDWQKLRSDYFAGKIKSTNPQPITGSPSVSPSPSVVSSTPTPVSSAPTPASIPPSQANTQSIIPKDGVIVQEGMAFGVFGSGFYWSYKNGVTEGNILPTYSAKYVDYDVDIPGGVTINTPVANPGALIHPYLDVSSGEMKSLKDGDAVYVYRYENSRVKEYRTISKNVWGANPKGAEGVLVDSTTNKFFEVKKDDVVVIGKPSNQAYKSITNKLVK
ncbi:MAG: hypothetical protein V1645_03400 [archaeon]